MLLNIGVSNQFEVITDNAAITHILDQKTLLGRQAKWAMFLQQFPCVFRHVAGSANAAADALS